VITITHPHKILFPDSAITKGELAAYYEMVAPYMVPHMRARPVTMERYHRGIGAAGFFQKDVSRGFPDWLQRVEVPKKGGTVHHPIVTDARSLLWLANQNCITPHVWTSRAPNLYYPDICVFDLDPSEENPAQLKAATFELRGFLADLGLPSWLKTSGSKGFHIVVPLDGKTNMSDVAEFAHTVGTLLVKRDPANLTQEFHKIDRGRRILVDTGRNGYSATFAAAYAVRAKPGAPISAPCTWDELQHGDIGPQSFTLRSMAARIESVGDVWAEMKKRGRSLKRANRAGTEDGERRHPRSVGSPACYSRRGECSAYFLTAFLLQVLAIIHFIRRRPDTYWLWIILMFPGFGALAYILIEVIPDFGLLRTSFQVFPRRKRIRPWKA
jgi:bifunctional non-homologous end joining protein LigD